MQQREAPLRRVVKDDGGLDLDAVTWLLECGHPYRLEREHWRRLDELNPATVEARLVRFRLVAVRCAECGKEKPPMRRVVIASPWRGDTETHHRYLLDCLRDAYSRGEAPIAPHAIGPLVLDEEREREQGMAAGLYWLRVADALIVYEDLGISDGMQVERTVARAACIPVEYRSLPAWRGRRAS